MSKTSTVDHIASTGGDWRKETDAQRDFWLLYPSATGNGSLTEMMHALYYLPANYKLVILSNALSRDFMAMAESSFVDRVRFETGAGLSAGASPFSYAGAVIYDGTDSQAADAATPTVVVSQDASKDIEADGHNGFTVPAGNPEALATAILRIAYAK